MNPEELVLIKEAFHDERKIIKEITDEERYIGPGYYQGGSVYLTEDDELIDLEIQTRDYDVEDHVNYIEFAEQLYEKHHKKVNVYIYCIPSVKINIQLYSIKSDADFKIKLAQIQKNSKMKIIETIKNILK